MASRRPRRWKLQSPRYRGGSTRKDRQHRKKGLTTDGMIGDTHRKEMRHKAHDRLSRLQLGLMRRRRLDCSFFHFTCPCFLFDCAKQFAHPYAEQMLCLPTAACSVADSVNAPMPRLPPDGSHKTLQGLAHCGVTYTVSPVVQVAGSDASKKLLLHST